MATAPRVSSAGLSCCRMKRGQGCQGQAVPPPRARGDRVSSYTVGWNGTRLKLLNQAPRVTCPSTRSLRFSTSLEPPQFIEGRSLAQGILPDAAGYGAVSSGYARWRHSGECAVQGQFAQPVRVRAAKSAATAWRLSHNGIHDHVAPAGNPQDVGTRVPAEGVEALDRGRPA